MTVVGAWNTNWADNRKLVVGINFGLPRGCQTTPGLKKGFYKIKPPERYLQGGIFSLNLESCYKSSRLDLLLP